eukprot:SAG11_NODE_20759_length_438_cov_4.651917_1_plen_92_part_01
MGARRPCVQAYRAYKNRPSLELTWLPFLDLVDCCVNLKYVLEPYQKYVKMPSNLPQLAQGPNALYASRASETVFIRVINLQLNQEKTIEGEG